MAFALFAADAAVPDWLAQILVQFPVVGLVFVAMWWVARNTDRRHTEFRTQLREETERHREVEARHAAQLPDAIERLREQYETAIKELQEAIAGVRKEQEQRHLAEMARLQKTHDEHVKSKNAEIRRLLSLLSEKRKREED